MNTTGTLPTLSLTGDPVLARPSVPRGTIKLDAPALSATTDFRQVTPVTVDGENPNRRGAPAHDPYGSPAAVRDRLRFAPYRPDHLPRHPRGETDSAHAGRRMHGQYLLAARHPGKRHHEADGIFGGAELRDGAPATVTYLLPTFNAVGAAHLLVVEGSAQPGQCIVRGLISASRLEGELGLSVDAMGVAHCIEKVFAHPYGECS